MPRDHIKSDFMDKQAKENAKDGTGRGVLGVIGLLLLIGVGFGGFKIYEHVAKFDFYMMKRNVSIQLQPPSVRDGKPVVAVEIKNYNACDVSDPVFTYQITSKDDKPVGSGQVELKGTVPMSDSRTFKDVVLGSINGQPAHMTTDLVDMKGTLDKNLPKGFSARFSGAYDDQANLVENLKKLETEAPNFDGIHMALGLAYEAREDWPNALEEYKKATASSSSNANAHYHLGLALAHEQKTAEAIEELKRANQLAPDDKTIASSLASYTTPAK